LRTRGAIPVRSDDHNITEVPNHNHKLTYTTSRHPSSPYLFTHLRRICIRTFSCETLPRGSRSGPLLFGDDNAGYTIAFVFKLRDMRARGYFRTYALLALAGTDSYRVSRVMSAVTRIFAVIARWIAAAAECTLKSENETKEASVEVQSETLVQGLTPVSSFLAPRRNVEEEMDRGGDSSGLRPRFSRFSGFAKDVKAPKGLVELVGREGFFVELHVQFVKLLARLERELVLG